MVEKFKISCVPWYFPSSDNQVSLLMEVSIKADDEPQISRNINFTYDQYIRKEFLSRINGV
jgi:hypothetical protein